MSCGCSPSSNTPPGSTPSASASPPNSYGGQTTLPTSGSCVSNNCPQPPVSDAEEIDTYCATWVESLRPRTFGKLLLKFGASCLFTLKSKCSGWLYYDATSENVSVDAQPPFVPSAPQTTKWGFLAKVLTRQKTLCVDGVDVCQQEGRQELAAQLVEEVQCGEIAVIQRPKCGTVPLNESADLDKQVGIHVLKPGQRTTCESALFLVRVESNDPECPKYQIMQGIKLPQSDIGVATNQELASAKPPIWVRSGGTDENPCWTLKVNNRSASNELPANAGACQIPIFDGTQWLAKDAGLAYKAVAPSEQYALTAGYGIWVRTNNFATTNVTLPEKPEPRCTDGKVWADIEVWVSTDTGPSASDTGASVEINGTAYVGANTSRNGTNQRIVRLDVTSASTIAVKLTRTSGTGTARGSLNVLGYYY